MNNIYWLNRKLLAFYIDLKTYKITKVSDQKLKIVFLITKNNKSLTNLNYTIENN